MPLFEPGIPPVKPAEAAALPKSDSVADYLAELSGVIRREARKQWMWGEVSEYAERGGHHYLSLVAPRSDREGQAKVRAVLFKTNAPTVLKLFREVTGSVPRVGMRILILAQGQFDATFGFSLLISQIDATYTIGAAEAQLRKIREALERSGDLRRQQALRLPSEFTRVALIAPENAAGLGDFKAQSDRLSSAGICKFTIHPASFSGQNAEKTLLAAVELVELGGPWDAVAVIRGGGAKADLAELNIESVARALARLPYPVVTGIGHERDSTLLDEIACTRFDTPSKVIAHIEQTILRNAQRAAHELSRMHLLATRAAENARLHADKMLRSQRDSAQNLVTKAAEHADRCRTQSGVDVTRLLARAREQAQQLHDRALRESRTFVESQSRLMEMRIRSVRAYRPDQLMGLGYSIARKPDGGLIRSAHDAARLDHFDLHFPDAPLRVKPV